MSEGSAPTHPSSTATAPEVPLYTRAFALVMVEFLGHPISVAFAAYHNMIETREITTAEAVYCLSMLLNAADGTPPENRHGAEAILPTRETRIATLEAHRLKEFAELLRHCPDTWNCLAEEGENSLDGGGPMVSIGSFPKAERSGDWRRPDVWIDSRTDRKAVG